MTQDITSLIEKLEGAEVGSRELDMIIYELQNPTYRPVNNQKGRYFDPEVISAGGAEKYITKGTFVAPKYTTSLDAALTLAGQIFPDASVQIQTAYSHARLKTKDGRYDYNLFSYGMGNTPALALCAAIIRAQSEAR